MLDKFATTPPPPPEESAKVRMQVELPFQMGSTQFGKYIAAALHIAPADFQVCICAFVQRGTLRVKTDATISNVARNLAETGCDQNKDCFCSLLKA